MNVIYTTIQNNDASSLAIELGKIKEDMGMLWMLLSAILVFFMQAGFTLT